MKKKHTLNDSFDMISLTKKALISAFEKKKGGKASYREVAEMHEFVDKMVSESNEGDRAEEDDDIKYILRQDKIEHGAHNIRMVIAIYIELYKEPYPYKLKRNMPLLKESHAEVLEFYQSELYPDIIKHAYEDMFVGDFRLLENIEEYKCFFKEYTNNPSGFNIKRIKDFIPIKYLQDVPMDLFVL